ncbi:MAG: hypothetical protein J0H59_01715, partial [Comamonadaceae bacterium]|nr:hypothetical protein [Comamonadaceae bacterium]
PMSPITAPKGGQPTRQHIHLSTADHHCVGFHPWLTIQAARWLTFTSAQTAERFSMFSGVIPTN